MALKPHCVFQRGAGPIIAVAIHNGHQTRKSIERKLAISEDEQLREEDPLTGEWTQLAKTQIIGLRSRFEVEHFGTFLLIEVCTSAVYPMVMQDLRWKLATALRKAVAEFTGDGQQEGRPHYDAYGPTTFAKAVRLVDQQLCEVSESFDFLLQVTAVNAEQAWQTFKSNSFSEMPPLVYRHLPYHPNVLKRRLFAIEVERVEDPTLAYLFWEKRLRIDC